VTIKNKATKLSIAISNIDKSLDIQPDISKESSENGGNVSNSGVREDAEGVSDNDDRETADDESKQVQESAQESTDQGDSKPASDTGSPSINAKE
jgi:hypothetical protein